ncbi:MAG: alanine/ornithine racemase family PLP-dependent enzyme [Hymenobacteraceae bacterium]|nr:alanine/ornithine racemase family PLP-dependent enzyme [Hymenobacteraceae bacterium]MDX5397508.1 alanine/ornithine racemase family PLP-dependent enzyme [Hymenobacteraceae bacterium]MDX5442599.1 alanine/ornithine racemase family PLP-dependent enzyme [Hymenobacteraceae bacterium]MDX5513587.1 alanine/ornithine racemase family PLP-dependent enzyme [Hymenobacteraceae bacterium]
MAVLKLYRDKLRHNYNFLQELFKEHGIDWGVVTKLLCGNKIFLKEVLNLGVREVHDSRISNLKSIKELDPTVQTVYIKPAPPKAIPKIIRYADVSFQTEFETMRLLSEEAIRQGRQHKVIIMIELGDLREGVMGDDLVDFYARVFDLPNIEVIGIGANLNCLHGVMPSTDKLIQLSLYKQLIEAKFNRVVPWVSGGTSVTIPLLFRKQLPKGINHFRVGETLYFGADLFSGETIPGMEASVFELEAEIIEVTEKPMAPIGEMQANPSGETTTIKEDWYGQTTFRAIVDIGLLDINPKFMKPKNQDLKLIGASSDMLILDLDTNDFNLKVGDTISFDLTYMGALGILNSQYITKKVV